MNCPNCGRDIVYNGNYFCSGYPRECDWRHNPKNKVEETRLYHFFLEGKIKREKQ